jgi:uncharacterized protein (DUF433 family)
MTRNVSNKRKTLALRIEDPISAFSEDQVERITGLSKERLRYWARTKFFVPSYVEENQRRPFSRFYSFKDIVALKTLEVLRVRNGVTLQHLRKVAEKLSDLSDSVWTDTVLFVVNREVNFFSPDDGKPESVLGGQRVLEVALRDIIHDTSAEIVDFTQRRGGTIGKIERNRSIAGNSWVIAGTRIPVASIRRLHEDGYSVQQIIEEYPDLTPDDVNAAIRHVERKTA